MIVTAAAPNYASSVPSAMLETVPEVPSRSAYEAEWVERVSSTQATGASNEPIVVILSDKDSDTGPRTGADLGGPSVGALMPSAVT